MCFERAIEIHYFDTFSDLIHKLTDRDERAMHAGGSLFPFKSDRRRSTPAELPGRPSVHRMIPYDPNRKRINMLPASLLHPPAPAPHIPRPLLGSEQGGDWPFSLANMICMAMTSNDLLRIEWSKKKLHVGPPRANRRGLRKDHRTKKGQTL